MTTKTKEVKTTYGALLKKLAVTPMTRKEITKFLLARASLYKIPYTQGYDYYNSSLYGTTKRQGMLERFCKKTKDGKWKASKKAHAPFTPVRAYNHIDNNWWEYNNP